MQSLVEGSSENYPCPSQVAASCIWFQRRAARGPDISPKGATGDYSSGSSLTNSHS